MAEKKDELTRMFGAESVFDDANMLEAYSRDESFVAPIKPQLVVKPKDADEVQRIVKWANQTSTPLVPVSSGPPHFRGDTIPSVGGAVIVDLSGMNQIIRIDRRNKMVIVEPGVTFTQLQPELAREGLGITMPLLPRSSKSVMASFLEREPTLIPRYQWDMTEPLRCLEVVWGNGDILMTGEAGGHSSLEEQWKMGLAQVIGMGPFQVDYYRLVQGAQGAMGIVTWASLKCEIMPRLHKLFLAPSERLDDLLDFAYRILRLRYGDEFLFLNSSDLASILGGGADRIGALREQLPKWVLILGVAGYDRLPRERVEFQEKDIADIAQQFSVRLVSAIPRARGEEILEALGKPSEEPYWKLRYKGGCQDIFFTTTLNRTPEFIRTIYSVSEEVGYPTSEIGVYVQPVVQGVACHCEFNLPFDPDDHREVSKVQRLFTVTSEALIQQGAYFSRPYGIWADMAYNRDAQTTIALRKVKSIFDPNNVMNPGKLCF